MKSEEAIAEIRESGLYGNQVHMETLELALEALEKQVAKKPIWEGPHNQAKDDAIPYCSVCDTELEEDWNGCPDCLTPIDWSEE